MSRFAKYLLVLGIIASPVLATSASAHDPWRDGYRHQHQYHHGLRITSVGFRSPAARAGLERGDIILEVDGRDVRYPEQLHRALHATGSRGNLTVRDVHTGRVRQVRVYPIEGHIGVNVLPLAY